MGARRIGTATLGRAPAWVLLLAAGALALGTYYWVVPDALKEFWYAGFAPVSAGAIVLATLLRRPPGARFLVLLAAGMAMAGVGDLIWAVMSLSGDESFPTVADAMYVGGYVVMAVALANLFGRDRRGDIGSVIDASILMIGAGLVFWVFFMEPVVEGGGMDALSTFVAISLPMLDILYIGLVARILLGGGRRGLALWLVVGACSAFLASDVAYSFQSLEGTYDGGGLTDLGWLGGYLLLGASGIHPAAGRRTVEWRPQELFSRRRLALLGVASLMAPLMAVYQQVSRGHVDVAVIGVGSAALFILVLLRLAGVLGSLRRTLREREALEEQLRQQALHDPLTGLANRVQLNDLLATELRLRRKDLALLFVDVDDFKTVNDSLGHQGGDAVLVEFAARLRSVVRDSDLAVRIGGDEFAVALTGCASVNDATRVAERILEELEEPFCVAGREVQVRASIGVTLAESAEGLEELQRNADVAMYLAKSQGKRRFTVFDAARDAGVVRQFKIQAELERAVAAGEFHVDYQPIFELGTGRAVGVEALARWLHPGRGLVPPSEFIPVAEATGLVTQLGRRVLEQASADVADLQLATGRGADLGLSVNVSAVEIQEPGYAKRLLAIIAGAGLPAESLTLELTESARLDPERARPILESLRARGVRVAIDDFGTGYGSLNLLASLPFDVLKIDRSFVSGLAADGRRAALVRATAQLAATLGMESVAEGIESSEQVRLLVDLGCRLGQGFALCRPVPVGDLRPLLAATSRRPDAPLTGAIDQSGTRSAA